jgi:hypothetical protein
LPVTNAAVQAEYGGNDGNQRDTGHWVWPAPPTGMAEQETVGLINLNFRFWPIV